MEPIRTCVGCRRRSVKAELVRLTAADGRVVLDQRQPRPGRGAYLHRSPACWQAAIRRRALPRALRAPQVDSSGVLDQFGPPETPGEAVAGPRSESGEDHDRGPLR